jgi:aconitase B
MVAKAGFLMIHNAAGIVLGGADEFEAAAKVFRQFNDAMAGIYADRSGVDRAKIKKWMDAETFFNGEDAVKHGFADSLLASDDVEEDEETPAKAALTRLDVKLAAQGMPRAERRALLSEAVGGMPRATPAATPRAGDQEAVALLHDLTSIFKS